MISMCEWCDYKEYEWLLHKSLHWSVYLADEQDYVGRCILVLNRHCGSLSELDISEWIELKTIIEQVCRTANDALLYGVVPVCVLCEAERPGHLNVRGVLCRCATSKGLHPLHR